MNAVSSQLIVPAIGAALPGGICLAHVFVDGAPYALIVPPKAVRARDEEVIWSSSLDRVAGALSYFDGLANTKAMAEAGSELGKWALEQRIGDFDDWFIPSRQDLLAIRGNVGAVPDFAPGGAEAFGDEWYWSSTQNELDVDWAWLQFFGGGGGQSFGHKSGEGRAFVVRRLPIR